MNLIDEIREYWGWCGIEPDGIVAENDFGNLIIRDTQGRYWRLCPEDCYCSVIADNRAGFEALSSDEAFIEDWEMATLASMAAEVCAPLNDGWKYCMKVPGVLGGEYGGDNLSTAPLSDIVRMAGDIARQITGLPDGTNIALQVDV